MNPCRCIAEEGQRLTCARTSNVSFCQAVLLRHCNAPNLQPRIPSALNYLLGSLARRSGAEKPSPKPHLGAHGLYRLLGLGSILHSGWCSSLGARAEALAGLSVQAAGLQLQASDSRPQNLAVTPGPSQIVVVNYIGVFVATDVTTVFWHGEGCSGQVSSKPNARSSVLPPTPLHPLPSWRAVVAPVVCLQMGFMAVSLLSLCFT